MNTMACRGTTKSISWLAPNQPNAVCAISKVTSSPNTAAIAQTVVSWPKLLIMTVPTLKEPDQTSIGVEKHSGKIEYWIAGKVRKPELLVRGKYYAACERAVLTATGSRHRTNRIRY